MPTSRRLLSRRICRPRPELSSRLTAERGGSGTGSGTNYTGDAFVAKISASGSSLLACTYLGGSAGEGGEGIAVDSSGNVYVSGGTYSTNFRVTADAFQGHLGGSADFYLVKLSTDLTRLIYGTYIGGSGTDYGRTVMVDGAGNGVMAGEESSSNWPLFKAFDTSYGGQNDGGVFRFAPATVTPPTPVPPTRRSG